MFKIALQFLILFLFLLTFPLSAQPGIKGGLAVSGLQSSSKDFTPFLGYEVSWLQHGTSNPVFGLQLGVFYTVTLIIEKNSIYPQTYKPPIEPDSWKIKSDKKMKLLSKKATHKNPISKILYLVLLGAPLSGGYFVGYDGVFTPFPDGRPPYQVF